MVDNVYVRPATEHNRVKIATEEVDDGSGNKTHYPLYKLVGEALTPAYIDEYSGAVGTLTQSHQKVHQGKLFQYTLDTTIADSGGILRILFKSNGSFPHYQRLSVQSGGTDVDIELYEEPTVTDEGTLVTTVRNHSRNSTNTPSTEIYTGATITDDGAQLDLDWLVGDKKTGSFGESGDVEWNLKASAYSMLKITNNSTTGGPHRFVIKAVWYE